MDAFARYYEVDSGLETEDIPFYLALARRAAGPILEVACGTGRVLVPLARAGFEVVGLDVSPAMLEIARAKVEAAGLQARIRLVQADARSFALGERFGLAVVALNSFMHFVEDGDPERVLLAVARHLRPEGLLAIDLPNPEATLLAERDGALVHEWTRRLGADGRMVQKLRSQRVDSARQVLQVEFVYDDLAPDGLLRRTVLSFPMRYFFPREMDLLLEKCGYEVEGVYGSHELDPFESDSPKMILLAGVRS